VICNTCILGYKKVAFRRDLYLRFVLYYRREWFRSVRSLNHSVRPPSQIFGEDAPGPCLDDNIRSLNHVFINSKDWSGRQCKCNLLDQASNNDKCDEDDTCNGQGECKCGKCKCKPDYLGTHCKCPTSEVSTECPDP